MPMYFYGPLSTIDSRLPTINAWLIPSTVSVNGLPTIYYPFWTDILDYSANTVNGVSNITVNGTTPPAYSTTTSYNAKAAGSFFCSNINCNAVIRNVTLNTASGGTGMTVCFWFYLKSDAPANMIWTLNQDTSTNKGNRVLLFYNGTNVYFQWATGAQNLIPVNKSTWYFSVLVQAAAGTPKYFCNTAGQTLSFTNATGFTTYNFTSNSSHFLFGDPYVGSNYGGTYGYINNFYYFPRALSDAEIGALYNQ